MGRFAPTDTWFRPLSVVAAAVLALGVVVGGVRFGLSDGFGGDERQGRGDSRSASLVLDARGTEGAIEPPTDVLPGVGNRTDVAAPSIPGDGRASSGEAPAPTVPTSPTSPAAPTIPATPPLVPPPLPDGPPPDILGGLLDLLTGLADQLAGVAPVGGDSPPVLPGPPVVDAIVGTTAPLLATVDDVTTAVTDTTTEVTESVVPIVGGLGGLTPGLALGL